MNEFWGKVHFWPSLICMNVIFLPMFLQGMLGMHRRWYDGGQGWTYGAEHVWGLTGFQWNTPISWAAWIMGLAQIPFIINFFWSIKHGKKVDDNPWEATTLEWTAPSPPPHGNFVHTPVAYRGPYEYSLPGTGEGFHHAKRTGGADRTHPAQAPDRTGSGLTDRAMEIPYTVSTRPDTGLWNAKIGIWLFLASEVMLFGGLFSAYIFLRIDAPPGMWPHGLLNVPVGTMNTAILIASSVTVVLAWAALKMRRYRAYWWYMLATISCGVIFLSGQTRLRVAAEVRSLRRLHQTRGPGEIRALPGQPSPGTKRASSAARDHRPSPQSEALHDPNIKEYEVALDPVNAYPTNPDMDRPHFLYVPPTDKIAVIEKAGRGAGRHVYTGSQHLFRELFHHHRFARPARAGRGPRLYLYVAAGQQKNLPAQSRTSG